MKPPYKMAVVEWGDASTSTDFGDDKVHAPVITYSCGFVVKKNRSGITLAQDCYEKKGEWRTWGFIPKGMIRRVVYLEEAVVKSARPKAEPKHEAANNP